MKTLILDYLGTLDRNPALKDPSAFLDLADGTFDEVVIWTSQPLDVDPDLGFDGPILKKGSPRELLERFGEFVLVDDDMAMLRLCKRFFADEIADGRVELVPAHRIKEVVDAVGYDL